VDCCCCDTNLHVVVQHISDVYFTATSETGATVFSQVSAAATDAACTLTQSCASSVDVSKASVTASSLVSAAATDTTCTVTQEPSTASHSYRLRHDSPHPHPHVLSKPTSSVTTDVSANIVATDTVITAEEVATEAGTKLNAAVDIRTGQMSDGSAVRLDMPADKLTASVDMTTTVADMSYDSDIDTQSEIAGDAVNSTFTLTSPSVMSASADTERQTTVNALSSVTGLCRMSDSPSSLPPGRHCSGIIILISNRHVSV